MIGKNISYYKILEKLGEGGMGIVYKAEDTKLKRTVALKFLPQELTRDAEAKARFIREAQATSALQHTNICTIHDIDQTDDDEMFIVMEYIDGQEIKEKISKGPITIDETIKIATQIAEGLQAAHSKEIVHRDIKSANIMITGDAKVKIMDFGLAKIGGGAQLTKDHSTLGTAAYMSPEQARGESVDQRADIWSFGVVLYEMLTGKMPFRGDYEQAIIYHILNQEPESLSTFRSDDCQPLQEIVRKALAKNVNERYQSFEELLTDLSAAVVGKNTKSKTQRLRRTLQKRKYLYTIVLFIILAISSFFYWWQLASDGQMIDSIAVLPLENLSGDPTQDYFADGMTETLIMDLSKIHNLKVISRTSVMQYKQVKKPLPEIADELDVEAVIEGSVIREGDQVRITAQLIEAATNKHLWAESYDRNMTNILSLQREIALAIAAQIKVVLSPEEEKRLAAAEVVDPKAHENYLKGRQQCQTDTEAGYLRSIDYFSDAINSAPTYALAHSGLADAYQHLSGTWMAADEAYPKALAAVERALELDPELNEAHLVLARIKFTLEWDWDGAEREFLRVLELNPNSAEGHERYAIFLALMGRFDEATRKILRARELDPLSAWINDNVGWIHFLQRQYEKALPEYQKTLEMYPGFTMAHREQAIVYMCLGMRDQAIEAAQKAISISDNDVYCVMHLGLVYSMAGEREQAYQIIERVLQRSKTKPIPLYELALIYGVLGEHDKAFEYLEQSYEKKSSWPFQIKVDPLADNLRSDPRYAPFLRKMGLEP